MSVAERVEHRFGPYGGQYVPETLMPALAELEAGVARRARRPGFRAELDGLLRDYVGRPTPLYLARAALARRPGGAVYLKREDLIHTGAHKINNALGQALLARRMGKRADHRRDRRRPARRRHRHRLRAARTSSASSTWAPRTCAARRPTSQRMELLGATVVAGRRRRADAEGGDVGGDPRLGRPTSPTTHYIIGSAVGPAPYPAIVRDLQRVIGDEARAQLLEREGRLPDRVIACVGGGSNAIGIFARLRRRRRTSS